MKIYLAGHPGGRSLKREAELVRIFPSFKRLISFMDRYAHGKKSLVDYLNLYGKKED